MRGWEHVTAAELQARHVARPRVQRPTAARSRTLTAASTSGRTPRGSSPLELAFDVQLAALGLPRPEAEVAFHPTRKWRFDRAWRAQKLALEIEGGTWVKGRHSRGKGYEADCEKLSEAAILGWRVVRVTSGMVTDGRAIRLVERALAGLSIHEVV